MELFNRELSWLSFNERVLQEALDEHVPIVERMHFLGIYSKNLDEFFRVRVANIRRMIVIHDKQVEGFDGTPQELYDEIRKVVIKQQELFEVAYRQILKKFAEHNIHHVDESQVNESQQAELSDFYHLKLKHEIVPLMHDINRPFPGLKDSRIYLAVKMQSASKKKVRYAFIEIPNEFPRVYRLKSGNKEDFILLDDIIRLHLNAIFSIFEYPHMEAFTFKFTRDAELNIDDDVTVSFMERIEKSVKMRRKGAPVRFVYDQRMPDDLLELMMNGLGLKVGVNSIPGGRYHNFKDFIYFPTFENPLFVFKSRPPNPHPDLEGASSVLKVVLEKDILIHFPYQKFDYIVDLLRESAIDPKVSAISINVYRVSHSSQVMKALLNAVDNGKEVTVVLELQARFDEENNVYWSERLQEAGAHVHFGLPELKVHSKLIQITRQTGKKKQLITYVGTGNFHEKTALIYEDLGLLTSNEEISKEVQKVFNVLTNQVGEQPFRTLLVSPFNTRGKIEALIDSEIRFAKNGSRGLIRLKMNNLVDSQLIEKLYKASRSGVKIELNIRGICCLVPGVPNMSENIQVISIVDRYLEHARFLIFGNGGDPLYFLTSADWMERNLDKRIEVGCPVYDKEIQAELDLIFDYEWKANRKVRIIDMDQKNEYKKTEDGRTFRAQKEIYKYYVKKYKSRD
jgi:polyphosphate kinase